MNTGFKGIDIKQTGNELVLVASLKDNTGAILTTGTTTVFIDELQSDGTIKSYDFADNTFKSTILTTATANATHRPRNNTGVNTGIWTFVLSTLTGFTKGAIYIVYFSNIGASPPQQESKFQYGGAEGDLIVTDNGTGIGELNVDMKMVSGTPQTARDIGASVLVGDKTGFSLATTQVFNNTGNWTGNISTVGGQTLANLDVPSSTLSTNTDMQTVLTRLSAARATYLDNLNIGGVVASHADILAINQSASKHILIATVGQYERPESGNVLYPIEVRTFRASDGSIIDADSTPTLTANGQISGDLSANLSAATHPSTGIYRYTYTVASNAISEPIRFDVSAGINAATFTLSTFSQVIDEVSQTWTSTNAAQLTSIFNKLPSKSFLSGTNTSSGAIDDKSNYTLSPIYDAAKTAAQTVDVVNGISSQIITDHGAGSYISDNISIAAIKNKTDQLTFTIANKIDSTPYHSVLTALSSMIVGNQFTVNSLSNAPSGGSGGTNTVITLKDSEVILR